MTPFSQNSVKKFTKLLSVMALAVIPMLCIDANATTIQSIPYVTTTPGSTYQCEQTTCTGLEMSDTSILQNTVACSSSKKICYQTKTLGGGTTSMPYTISSCTVCPEGTERVTKEMDSTMAKGCTVTYYVCQQQQTTICPSECPSTTWSNDSSQTGRQIRCNSETNKCEYQCSIGYYDQSMSEDGTICEACPENGTCTNSNVCCSTGRYTSKTTSFKKVGNMYTQVYVKSCKECPELDGVTGTTSRFCPDSVTYCYIPANTTLSGTAGKYIFTSNCSYTNYTVVTPGGGSIGTVTPVQP